jgi:hypothetical protein
VNPSTEVVVFSAFDWPATVRMEGEAVAKEHNTVRGNVSTPATLSSVQVAVQLPAVDGPLMILGRAI